MANFWQDLRYGARTLFKNPGFALVAIVTLALGIGANTALFSVIDAVLLRPLPYPDPERLVVVRQAKNGETGGVSYPNLLDWRERNTVFERIAVFNSSTFTVTGGGEAARLAGAVISSDLFDTLGAAPMIGRNFTADEEEFGGTRTVVLSYGLWQRRFGARGDVLGQTINLDGAAHTVIGVMPADFAFPIVSEPVELWVSVAADADPEVYGGTIPTSRGYMHYEAVIARLKSGVTVERAQAEMDVVAGNIARQHPDADSYKDVQVTPALDVLVGDVRAVLWLLFGAVTCVLLIGCANVANLLLARSASRRREFAVRAALGAGRWRVARQTLVESLLLAGAGGAIGLLLAVWGVDLLVALAPEGVPRAGEIGVRGRVFAFAFVVSLATGLVFGLAPALAAAKSDVNETLKDGTRGASESRARRRLRGSLILAETAIALVLLVSAGLLINSFVRLRAVDPGFDAHNVVTFGLELPVTKYPMSSPQVSAFYNSLTERLRAVPGVASVSAAQVVPLSGNNNSTTVKVEGAADDGLRRAAGLRFVNPEYFRTMNIRLVEGRDFSARDDQASPPCVVVNETFVRQFFGGASPLNKRLLLGWGGGKAKEVVGVVRDVKHVGLGAADQPEMYIPQAQFPVNSMSVVLRAKGDPLALVAGVREQVRALDPDLPINDVKTLDEYVSASVKPQKFAAWLLTIFSGLALTLTAVGLYGVIAYSVSQRTREIGVRMALGANKADVLRLVIRQGMTLTLIGVAVGLLAALWLTRLMTNFLYGVTATDPLTFVGVSLVLLGVALLACYVPARRAAKTDPLVALRYE